ncbi:cell division protein ZapD [Psychrobium sp. MM17-31]|uniref:cell division protein ZapD n=1 Tax=Psychrobium sp. MM17-31 TaxID=2917758 RepID=UPI001EF500E0|nr:cell division protein ZapD [Psychrobium sp. MM17-31]MCG7533245.1 cell division protein ZapD [Psychrobium sp. MM17-31]
MSETIIYEYPLTEKIRCYLRIENLSDQLLSYKAVQQPELFKPFFGLLFSLAEQFDRGELKKELIRDLDTQKHSLNQWRNEENIDQEQLTLLIDKLETFKAAQSQPNKPQQNLCQDPLLAQIKNKSSLPGGGSPFDTPLLHYWNHLPQQKKEQDIERWLAPFEQSIEAIRLLLQLTRESSSYQEVTAREGFYQNSCEQLQLLRIKLMAHQDHYPTISGYKNRYAVRFQSWNDHPVQDVKFLLSCC